MEKLFYGKISKKTIQNSEQIMERHVQDVKKVSIPWVTAHVVKLLIFSPTKNLYIYIYV